MEVKFFSLQSKKSSFFFKGKTLQRFLSSCGGGIRPNKEKTSKVLYMYFSWRGDRWEQHMLADPHACAVMPWGGGLLAWLGMLQL
jgi:hypothetical protein